MSKWAVMIGLLAVLLMSASAVMAALPTEFGTLVEAVSGDAQSAVVTVVTAIVVVVLMTIGIALLIRWARKACRCS